MNTDWKPSACMICSTTCGIEVQTDYGWRAPVIGTPWHKYVPARLERVN